MKQRKLMVAGNWKMNKTVHEAQELIANLLQSHPKIAHIDAVLCPPFTVLYTAHALLAQSTFQLGAQNMHWEDSGAFTGEIAPQFLAELCDYVILGHSERRAMFGESNTTVNKKLHAALAHHLKPIICVGESLAENQAGETEQVVASQCREGLAGIEAQQASQIIIAYEPVWAIGTGLAATPQQANDVHAKVIRPVIAELFGKDQAQNMRILYGGSVNPQNAYALFSQSDIDGGLIGGASLKAESFNALLEAAETLSQA